MLERYAEEGLRNNKLQLTTTGRGLSAGRLMAAGGVIYLTRPSQTPKVDTPGLLASTPPLPPGIEEAG